MHNEEELQTEKGYGERDCEPNTYGFKHDLAL